MRPTVNKVVDFLYTLYVQELSYSTINTARSALASYLMDIKFKQIYSLYKFKLMRQHVEGKLLCKRCEKTVPSDYVIEKILFYLIEL